MINGNKSVSPKEIVKGIGAGLCLLDRDFRIVWVNKFQSDWFGAPAEICGEHCYKIFEQRRHICRGCPAIRVFKTGAVHMAVRNGITKDEQKRYYQLTVSPIKDSHNKVIFALELVQDITDTITRQRSRLKAIKKLRHISRRLSSVNKKLCCNEHKLKDVIAHLSLFKSLLTKKYHRKVNELSMMKNELQDIFRINCAINTTVDLKKVTALVARLSCELMHSDGCLIRLLDERTKMLAINASYGISDACVKKIPPLKVGESICGEVAKTKKPLAIYELGNDPRAKHSELVTKEGFKSLLCVPVKAQDKVSGVITTFSRKKRQFQDEEIELLCIFASQLAIAIQEAKHCEDVHANYFNTIHALVLAIEAKDPYSRGHTERVTSYALIIGRALKMPQMELEILRYAGEMHDIGKISIPDFILTKPGKLTPEERATIEIHPVKGAEMLEPLEFLRPAIPIVRHHHERYDGRGYPDGLEKEKIPVISRILACADAFDAMTSDRPYRKKKLTTQEALLEIRKNAGSQFDPHIAHLFIKAICT